MTQKVRNIAVVILIPALLYAFFTILKPGSFGKVNTLYIIVTQSFITCTIAWGMHSLIGMGNFDLAIGAEMVLDSILAALLCDKIGFIGIPIGCIGGALACGAIKSVLYRYLRIPTMILTIALVYLFGAAGGIITNSKALTIPTQYTFLGRAPGNIIIFVVVGLVIFALVNYNRYGAHVRAVSGSEAIAKVSGISIDRTMILALMQSSFFAGIAAIIQLSHGSGVTPSIGLDSIQNIMEPIMSVFIGMVMAKYVNIVFSIFIGSIMMSIVSNGITALNWSSSIYNVVVGMILIVIMAYMNVAEIVLKNRTERISAAENMKTYSLTGK